MWMEDGKFIVSHDEFIADQVTESNNLFAYNVYSLNPGNNVTFPWLSIIATNFESYRFRKLRFTYRGFCGTGTSGQAVLAIDYDSNDSTTNATKASLLSTSNSVACSLWDSCVHHSTLTDLQRVGPYRFVETNTLTTGDTDLRLSSAGNLFVATTNSNIAGGTGVGELSVSYEVEFVTPILHSAGFSRGRNPSHLVSPAQFTASSTTDALGFPSRVGGALQTRLLDFVSGIPQASVFIDDGQSQPWNSTPLASALAAGQWQILPSGSLLPLNQSVIGFSDDFAGRLIVSIASGIANAVLPNFGSLAVATVARDPNLQNASPQSGTIEYDLVSAYSTLGTGILNPSNSVAMGQAIIDVIASAGSGLSLTVPSWTPGTAANEYSYNVQAIPGNAVFAAAFRERKRLRALPKTMASSYEPVPQSCVIR